MTDLSAFFQPPQASQPDAGQILGIPIPTIQVCDVGAMVERDDRYAPLILQGLANVIGFEPNPKQFARLQAEHRPHSQYFPFFLGNGGPATFHLARYSGCSSLYQADPGVIDLFSAIGASIGGNFTVKETEEVQTTRLDDVPGLPTIDYLKLDVQGAELDVLKGGDKALSSVVVIESEVEFVPLYKDQPLFGDVQVFLRERGFMLHKFIDIAGRGFRPFTGPKNNPHTAMSQILWADAIFVRDFSRLETYSDDQLIKAAVILIEVYRSYDLAHLLLVEYDRRRQTQIAPHLHRAVMTSSNLRLVYMTQKLNP